MPQLLILKLHENQVLEDNNYERFSYQWFLECSSNTPSVQPGDVLYIPELSTGAGEFEAVRFVSSPNEEEKE